MSFTNYKIGYNFIVSISPAMIPHCRERDRLPRPQDAWAIRRLRRERRERASGASERPKRPERPERPERAEPRE